MDEGKPKGDEKKVKGHPTRNVGKKTYFWCPHHNNKWGQWIIHNPDECKNKPASIMDKKEGEEDANMAADFDMVDSHEEE